MIENVLNVIFTENIIAAMGDYYQMIYSWSVFALVIMAAIIGAGFFWAVISTILRWLK